MSPRPRVPLGLETSRATLNIALCAHAGSKLVEARTARGLSVAEVAGQLMLSPAQVTALERAQPEAFYGAEFYATALRKYLQYLNLDTADASRVIIGPPAHAGSAPAFRRPAPPAQAPTREARRVAPLAVALAAASVAGVALAGWWWLGDGRLALTPVMDSALPARAIDSAEPGPPATVPTPVDPSAGLPALAHAATVMTEPADGGLDTTNDSPFGLVTVARSTWVFVRYVDNSTEAESLSAGARFRFRSEPVYVIVGTAEGTTINIGGHHIDTARYTTNGQVRIGKSSLVRLMASR